MKLTARRKCSFGNGTRGAGFEFGTFEINDGVTPYEFEKELILPRRLLISKQAQLSLLKALKRVSFLWRFAMEQ